MSDQKFIRIALAVLVIILLGFVFSLFVDRPTLTNAAAITPPPRTPDATKPPSPGGSGSDESNGPTGSISGQVIDLATGRPAAGIKVEINGEIVTTDGRGHYSRTGLEAGTYVIRLLLPPGIAATQSVWEATIGQNEAVLLDLNLNSQAPPTATPSSQAESPTPTPTAAVAGSTDAASPPTPTPTPRRQQAIPSLFVPSGDEPILWINPGYINNEQGVAGFITIDVMNVVDLGAFQAILEFDPKVIEIESVLLGDFLNSTGRQTTPLVTKVDNTSGQVSFVAFTSGDKAGPDGGGTLAVVNFSSKQAGVSDLVLDNVRLVTRLGEIIVTEVGNGQVNVSACFGDLNADKIIDISDLQIVAGRVGQSLGDINYQSGYDVNSDGVIDDNDVLLITDRLYEICP